MGLRDMRDGFFFSLKRLKAAWVDVVGWVTGWGLGMGFLHLVVGGIGRREGFMGSFTVQVRIVGGMDGVWAVVIAGELEGRSLGRGSIK